MDVYTPEQMAERLRALGYDISAQGVRWHMRQGRAGFRVSDRWGGTEEDVEKLREWVGRKGPRPEGERV